MRAIALVVTALAAPLLGPLVPGASAQSRSIALVSSGTANADASVRGISDDGSHAFFVTAEPLSAADTDTADDVYERSGGTTTLVSPGGANTGATFVDASADGTRVFFLTDESLSVADTDAVQDVYERSGGTTALVSGGVANTPALFVDASADGTRVIFVTSEALSADDFDTARDVYERSRAVTTLVSGGAANMDVSSIRASEDGTRVFFATAEKLAVSDNDLIQDVYERSGGTTTLVSGGGIANKPASFVGASTDGTRVFFATAEKLAIADTDTAEDVYERSGGTTKLVSLGSATTPGFFSGASADGTRVFFRTTESLSVDDVDTALDLYQRSSGTTTLVSGGATDTDVSFSGASSDGTRVLFATTEALSADDTDTATDLYERSGAATTLISGGTANTPVVSVYASADGTRVFFATPESLTAADTDTAVDVYERSGGTTTLVTGGTANTDAFVEEVSADGSRVFFLTDEPLTANDTDTASDAYESGPIPAPEPDPAPDPAPDPGGDGPGQADTTAPTVTFTGSLKKKVRSAHGKRKINFAFVSDEPGSTFACELDGRPIAPCGSPQALRVRPGKHRFTVRATDAAGNIGQQVLRAFRVVRAKRR